jgi:hypothetical protein
MTSLKSVMNYYMQDRRAIDLQVLLDIVRNVRFMNNETDIPEYVNPIRDILSLELYNDNLNSYINSPRIKIPDIMFEYSMGFNIIGIDKKFYVPMPCYVAAVHDKFTVRNIMKMIDSLDTDREKSLFVQCLKINKNIKNKRTKLFVELL